MMNKAILVCLLASVNVMLVTSKAFPILEFEIDLNTDELPIYEDFEKRSLDNLKYGNILKRSFGPGSLDPLGNGNIPKWSKKSSYTRDYRRSLDSIGNGINILKRAFGPGAPDPLGNGNIPKWSKKNDYTRDFKRSLDHVHYFRIAA